MGENDRRCKHRGGSRISVRVCDAGFPAESSRTERSDSKRKIKFNAVELEALVRGGGNKHMVELQQRHLNISERNTTRQDNFAEKVKAACKTKTRVRQDIETFNMKSKQIIMQ